MENAKGHQSVITQFGPVLQHMLVKSLLLLMAVGSVGCDRTAPEQQLRDQLIAVQQAVEDGRIGDAMEAVAEDFGGAGGMDRAALHNLLRAQLVEGCRIGVTTTPHAITINGDAATVRFDALFTVTGQPHWLPENAHAYEVTLGWRGDGNDWRIHHADWKARR